MTLIQTHETELRARMERAGIEASDPNESGYYWLVPHDGGHLVFFHDGQSVAVDSIIGFGDDETDAIGARHPDPRIALRACLDRAGLLVDRPPQTDAELVRWLTERHGDGVLDVRDGLIRWPALGEVLYDPDDGDSERRWSRASSDEWCPARELGAILWCAERFPEVKP